MKNNGLKEKILRSIEKRLGLEHIDVQEDSFYDMPIFSNDDKEGAGLELDSIDAIEIIIVIKEDYNVRIGDEDMKALRTISSIAAYVEEKMNI